MKFFIEVAGSSGLSRWKGLDLVVWLVCLSGVVLLLTLPYGFQYLIAQQSKTAVFSAAAILLLGLLYLVFHIGGAVSERGTGTVPLFFQMFCVFASLFLTLYFNSKVMPTPALIATLLLSVAALVLAIRHADGRLSWALMLLAIFVTHSYIAILTENDYRAANMLPVIQASCWEFAQGMNAYLLEHADITTHSVYYFPALIAPYCPAEFAGIDVRWVNVLIFGGILIWLGRGWLVTDASIPRTALTALAVMLASPMVAQMMAHGHIWLFFAACLALGIQISAGNLRVAALLTGLILASYQLSIFLVVPLFAWLASTQPMRMTVQVVLIVVATFALLVLPAAMVVPDFVGHFYLQLSGKVSDNHISQGDAPEQVAIGGLIMTLVGSKNVLLALQALVLLSASWLAAFRRVGAMQALSIAGLAYCIIIALNPFINRYFYIPGLFFLCLSLFLAPLPSRRFLVAQGIRL